jgi:hypothetical protein
VSTTRRKSFEANGLFGPNAPVVLVREGRLAKLREEWVEAIQWNRLRRRDLDAQRFA